MVPQMEKSIWRSLKTDGWGVVKTSAHLVIFQLFVRGFALKWINCVLTGTIAAQVQKQKWKGFLGDRTVQMAESDLSD